MAADHIDPVDTQALPPACQQRAGAALGRIIAGHQHRAVAGRFSHPVDHRAAILDEAERSAARLPAERLLVRSVGVDADQAREAEIAHFRVDDHIDAADQPPVGRPLAIGQAVGVARGEENRLELPAVLEIADAKHRSSPLHRTDDRHQFAVGRQADLLHRFARAEQRGRFVGIGRDRRCNGCDRRNGGERGSGEETMRHRAGLLPSYRWSASERKASALPSMSARAAESRSWWSRLG